MPASTRPASFEWAFGTVLQKNNNWAEAEPGESGSPHDKFRCNFCSKDFQCLLPRVRAHVAGVKGFDVKACTGPSKRDDETIRSFETRVEQFKHARDRCKTAIEEKQSEASKKKRALLMDAATGVSTRTASKVARQAGIITLKHCHDCACSPGQLDVSGQIIGRLIGFWRPKNNRPTLRLRQPRNFLV